MALATQQLTDFLSVVADRPDEPAAQHAAVECAARALDAHVAVLLVDAGVVAAVGMPPERVPVHALTEVAAGGGTALVLEGRTYAVTYAEIDGDRPGVLVLARVGAPFGAEEVCLLRGMTRVLELSLQALHVIP